MKQLFLLCLTISIFLFSCKEDKMPTVDTTPFLINPGEAALNVAHRGGSRLAPENTMLSFNHAIELGANVLEMDVCLTNDSVLVTCHDLTIDRTSDGIGNILDFTFEELQAFNFGHQFENLSGEFPYQDDPVRIPSFDQVLDAHSDQLLMIEIKNSGPEGLLAAELVNEKINAKGIHGQVVLFSFDLEIMDHIHEIKSPGLFAGASFTEGLEFIQAVAAGTDSLYEVRADIFATPTELIGTNLTSPNIIEAAHKKEVGIHYWTVNDKEEMKSLINKGADGIITDRPDLMLEALEELGF